MSNVFHVERRQTSLGERAFIVIRKLPSQIPYGIDSHLFHLAGISNLDGPHEKVEYQFSQPSVFDKGVRFLKSCGWSEEPIS